MRRAKSGRPDLSDTEKSAWKVRKCAYPAEIADPYKSLGAASAARATPGGSFPDAHMGFAHQDVSMPTWKVEAAALAASVVLLASAFAGWLAGAHPVPLVPKGTTSAPRGRGGGLDLDVLSVFGDEAALVVLALLAIGLLAWGAFLLARQLSRRAHGYA